jgi:hypothetical protein
LVGQPPNGEPPPEVESPAEEVLLTPNAAHAWNEFFVGLDNLPTIDHEDGFQMSYYHNEEWNDNAHELRERTAPLVTRAREIATMEHCDWELDYSQGFDLLLPHLGHLREVQRMLRYSMLGEMDRGNISSAMSDMNAMLGITQHHTESKIIIGSLVASSSFKMVRMESAIIDSVTDAGQLETLLASVEEFEAFDPFGIRANVGNEKESTLHWLQNTENPDFSIFESITGEQVDTSNLDMDEEIERFSFAMEKMETIFQMTDKEEALTAAAQLDQQLQDGGIGFLASVLSPSATNLLESAFRAEERVTDFKQLLKDKIDMLRNPNSATYFLWAVESYNAIDYQERKNAIAHGDFIVIDEPLALLAKACALPPTRITLANEAATPHWIAPLYALALDCIARGTSRDRLTILELIGHLSQQDRFATSILAAKLYDYEWGSTPSPDDPHLEEAFAKAKKQIPSADAFMLHRSAQSERLRLIQFYDIDDLYDHNEKWNPNSATLLSLTCMLAKLDDVDQHNPEAWALCIQALGIPDMHPSLLFAEEEYDVELMKFLKLPQEESFNEMIERHRTLIGRNRHTETTSKGR